MTPKLQPGVLALFWSLGRLGYSLRPPETTGGPSNPPGERQPPGTSPHATHVRTSILLHISSPFLPPLLMNVAGPAKGEQWLKAKTTAAL